MEKCELACWTDNEFLQYMQYVWSYYEVNNPSGISQTDYFQHFLKALTDLENVLLQKEKIPEAENRENVRLELTDCYLVLNQIAPIPREQTIPEE